MGNEINFGDLWAKQTSIEPDPENLILQINKIKRSNFRKLISLNLMLIAVSVFIVLIWGYFKPQLLTTKLGIILIILAITIYLYAYNKSYSLFKPGMGLQSNSDYLKDLLSIKSKQQFMHAVMLNVYFVLLSAGIGMYMLEYTSRMTTFMEIFVYVITAIWILINWFYFRPRQIKKQRVKLDEIIRQVENLNKQLDR